MQRSLLTHKLIQKNMFNLSSHEPKKDNKNSRENLIKSREYFVSEVADTINQNHDTDKSSFIFGISGKWGSGKTFFLNELEEKLMEKDNQFIIKRVNPWKFGSEKVAFLRTFLQKISKESGWKEWLKSWLTRSKQFDRLYYDITKTKIKPFGWVIIFVCVVLGIISYISPDLLSPKLFDLRLVSLIILPLLLAVLPKIITRRQSSKAVETIDRFDDILGDIIEGRPNRKLVIFIDDLDRVTPSAAREVLDNLRTFFDRPEITFVVTGDHSVLEEHLGREIVPNAKIAKQREEGRRFLKKIFNVYWDLPLPIKSELSDFIKEELSNNEDELKKIFSEPNQLEKFKEFLKKHFNRNFRRISRFIKTTLFTFRIISTRLDTLDESDDEFELFNQLKKHPLLVVRVLMIEELCTPLYEKILESHKVLQQLEYAAESGDQESVNQILTDLKKAEEEGGGGLKLSSTQESFIKNFLYEKPMFYQKSNLVVSDLRPFLFLSADSSFEDQKGPDPEDFIKFLERGDSNLVRESFAYIGSKKLEKATDSFENKFLSADSDKKISIIKTLLIALNDLKPESQIHHKFANTVSGLDFSFYENFSSEQRVESFLKFWEWIDKIDDQNIKDDFANKFEFNGTADLSEIKKQIEKSDEDLNKYGTRVISEWFNELYQNNSRNALGVKGSLDVLDNDEVKKYLDPDPIIDDILEDLNNNRRDKKIDILDKTNGGKEKLKNETLERISKGWKNNTAWEVGEKGVREGFWERSEIEQEFVNNLERDDMSVAELNDFLKAANSKVKEQKGFLWEEVIKHQKKFFLEGFPQIIRHDNGLKKIAPGHKKAEDIRSMVVKKAKDLEDEGEKSKYINLLSEDKAFWGNLDKGPDGRNTRHLKQIGGSVETAVKNVEDSWG